MPTRLNIPNGYNATVSPNGKFLTANNVECLIASLQRVGPEVTVAGYRVLSTASLGQAYGGSWIGPDELMWTQDQPTGRKIFRNDTYFAEGLGKLSARDGHWSEFNPGLRYDGVDVPLESGQDEYNLCEGWRIYRTNNNRAIRWISPTGAVTTRDFPGYVLGLIAGPGGLAIYRLEGSGDVHCCLPEQVNTNTVTLQAPSDRFPWGEGLGYSWKRPDGSTWLATWTVDVTTGSCWALVRPLGATQCLWKDIGPINCISVGEDEGWLVTVGAHQADAYAVAFGSNTPLSTFDPTTPPIDPEDEVSPELEQMIKDTNAAVKRIEEAQKAQALESTAAMTLLKVVDAPLKINAKLLGTLSGTLNPKEAK